MQQVLNTPERYGTMAVAFHWLMAVLLAGLVAMGLYMVSLPDAGFDKTKITLILWHKQFGILAFLLVAARFAWRLRNALPRLVGDSPDWQKVTARFVHLCLYAAIFALPLSGWIMSSAAGIPVSFFGLFYLPDLVGPNERLFGLFIDVHKWLAYALIVLFSVHAGAALWHHFMSRDDTLRRMLPEA